MCDREQRPIASPCISSVPPAATLPNTLSCVSCGTTVTELQCLPCLHPLALCTSAACSIRVRQSSLHCPACDENFIILPEALYPQPFASRKAVESSLQQHISLNPSQGSSERPSIYTLSSSSSSAKSLDSGLTDSLFTCKDHRRRSTQFCYNCNVLVCRDCLLDIGKHKFHPVTKITEELGAQQVALMKKHLPSIKHIGKRLRQSATKISDAKQTATQEKELARKEVFKMTEELIRAIVARRDLLYEEIDQVYDEKSRIIEEAQRMIASGLRRLNQFQKISTELLTEASTEEQLSLKKPFINRVRDLNKWVYSLPQEPSVSSVIHFTSNDLDTKLQDEIHGMGRIQASADPKKCEIKFEGDLQLQGAVRIRKNDPLWYSVYTKDRFGKPCLCGGENLAARMFPTTAGPGIKGYIEDLEDGKYRFSFNCSPAEECRLVVTLNGELVCGTPMLCRFLDYNCKRVIQSAEKTERYTCLALSPEGNIAAVDESTKSIHIFTSKGRLLQMVGKGKGEGPGQFKEWMRGIAYSSHGTLAVADSDNHRIQLFDANGHFIHSFGQDILKDPRGLTFNEKDELLVIDQSSICYFNLHGKFLKRLDEKKIPSMEGTSMTGPQENWQQIQVGPDGLLYITDKHRSCIWVLNEKGERLHEIGSYGRRTGLIVRPHDLAITKEGHIVISNHHKISIFKTDGTYVTEFSRKGAELGALDAPYGLVVDTKGYIYVADRNNRRIQVF